MKLINYFLAFFLLFGTLNAQNEIIGSDANNIFQGAEYILEGSHTLKPDFIRFRPGAGPLFSDFAGWMETIYQPGPGISFSLKKENTDLSGQTHYRYDVLKNGITVFGAFWNVHVQSGHIKAMNGKIFDAPANNIPSFGETDALRIAMNKVQANVYGWEDPMYDQTLQQLTGDPSMTSYPQGSLVFAPKNGDFTKAEYQLAWRFDIHGLEPMSRQEIFVDALSGEIVFDHNLMPDADAVGTAVTKYSGNQTITADQTGASSFRLRENGRGSGIYTYDLNNGQNVGAGVDFTDTDNFWDNVNPQVDEVATDCHWGMEMTFDYLQNEHSRASWDGNNGIFAGYVHFGTNYANASFNGFYAVFGDGGGGAAPLIGIDVVAHEFTHGMTGSEAGLIYQDEPGGLNESFSDIFGAMVEFYAKPGQANYLIGESHGTIRSMSDPKVFFNPDTYEGSYWVQAGGFDNGGVHINSGVQNFWYYLLAQGGSGTNDNGDGFSVTGIGRTDAADIAYRNLSVYLGPSSQFYDARIGSIQASIDLFGACSPQMQQVMNAWHAVGLGSAYSPTLTVDMETELDTLCSFPVDVAFTNLATGGIVSFFWQFGDGGTSTLANPTHTYNFFGSYNVTLTVTDCAGGTASYTKPAMVVIDPTAICGTPMPNNSQTVFNSCFGTLYDSGGKNGNYLDNNFGMVSIIPPGASQVVLTFFEFHFATAGDYIAVYDGPDNNAPLIANYNGTSLPGGGTVVSTGGSITIVERSNGFQNFPGFKLDWSCLVAADQGLSAKGEVKVFPNPSSGIFQLGYTLPQGEKVAKIFNLEGKVLHQSTILAETGVELLDLRHFSKGIYFLRVETSEGLISRKLVIN